MNNQLFKEDLNKYQQEVKLHSEMRDIINTKMDEKKKIYFIQAL